MVEVCAPVSTSILSGSIWEPSLIHTFAMTGWPEGPVVLISSIPASPVLIPFDFFPPPDCFCQQTASKWPFIIQKLHFLLKAGHCSLRP